jgi:hypothetical protein
MKNIYLLPTNKGQRITKTDEGKLLWCSTLAKDFIEIRRGYLGYHVYITSDEEIISFNEINSLSLQDGKDIQTNMPNI